MLSMMNQTIEPCNKKRPGRTVTLFPGIQEDARALGVNRTTLYKLLMNYPGFDSLKTLRRRYEELLKTKPQHIRDYIRANMAK